VGDVAGVQLDQSGHHVNAAGVIDERADDVSPLASTEPDHPDTSLRPSAEVVADPLLYDAKAPVQRRTGVVVLVVPLEPVPIGQSANVGRLTLRSR
jgi:hypothetical protein